MKKLLTIVAFVMLLLLMSTGVALALPAEFELDRNAQDGNAKNVLPDDWDSLFPTIQSPIAKVAVFVPDPERNNVFTGGGSKDINDVTQWEWTAGNVPDKDEITNAYAAAYNDAGDLIIHFGLDRYANNGDAQVGFWFFQNPIGLNPDGTFSGSHTVGDILVLSEFTNGGVISNINVYEWVGSGGTDGSLDLVYTGVDCVPGPSGIVCATVNQADTPAPWPYTPKSGTPGIFPSGSFYEGGINISELIPEGLCLSNFLAETRTSQSLAAELKDFALGTFDLCSVDVEKTGDTLSKVGDIVTYNFTIINTGASTLYLDTITDTVLGDLKAQALAADCGTLAGGASCSFSVDYTVPEGAPDPLINEVTVVYKSTLALTGPAISDKDDHSVDLVHPAIDVTKSADTKISKVGDTVNYTITVKNTGDCELVNITVSDSILGDLSGSFADTLAVGAEESHNFAYVVKDTDSDPLKNEVTEHANPPGGLKNDITDNASAEVDLVHPNFTVTKECFPDPVQVGASINYRITIDNTGDVALNYHVVDTAAGIDQNITGHTPEADPSVIETSRIVEPGEPSPLTNTVEVTATIDGLPNLIVKEASASCDIAGGATRTPGFWKTHYDYTNHLLTVHLSVYEGVYIDLGWKTLNTPEDVFGMLWADKAKNSDGSRRDKLCQARVIASYQVVAAILNSGLSNGAPLPVSLSYIQDTLKGKNIDAIRALGETLDAYNNSGDDIAIVDNDGYTVKPADPGEAKTSANLAIANCK
jgi:uncharacterized repeat protein (TIGR01451 family)